MLWLARVLLIERGEQADSNIMRRPGWVGGSSSSHVGMGIRPAVSRQCLAFFWQIVRQGHDWNITLCQVLKSLSMTFLRSVKHHMPLANKKEEAQSQGEKCCQDIGHVIPTVISLGFNAI